VCGRRHSARDVGYEAGRPRWRYLSVVCAHPHPERLARAMRRSTPLKNRRGGLSPGSWRPAWTGGTAARPWSMPSCPGPDRVDGNHEIHEIYRALLESTAFGTRRVIETFTQRVPFGGDRVRRSRERNTLLLQLTADIIGQDVSLLPGACVGCGGGGVRGGSRRRRRWGYADLRDAIAKMGGTTAPCTSRPAPPPHL